MDEQIPYAVAAAGDVGRLQARVEEMIEEGYELYGTLTAVWDPVRKVIMLYQPMVNRNRKAEVTGEVSSFFLSTNTVNVE